jgi:TRAP-type C4-dicarboxylate transport system permease small subunit
MDMPPPISAPARGGAPGRPPARAAVPGAGRGRGDGPVRRAMDLLYRLCAVVAGASLVLIALVIPWGVYTRYVLNRAASWPEPLAILLTVILTFIGAAACYRDGAHMRVSVLARLLPWPWRQAAAFLAEALTGLLSLFMVIWGWRLVATTWHQTVAEFPALSVGITYLPIPVGGAVLLLFIAERALLGPPPRRGTGESHAGGPPPG